MESAQERVVGAAGGGVAIGFFFKIIIVVRLEPKLSQGTRLKIDNRAMGTLRPVRGSEARV